MSTPSGRPKRKSAQAAQVFLTNLKMYRQQYQQYLRDHAKFVNSKGSFPKPAKPQIPQKYFDEIIAEQEAPDESTEDGEFQGQDDESSEDFEESE